MLKVFPVVDCRLPVNRGMPFLQACRVRWLVERVAAEGFMLAAEMPRYFKVGNLHIQDVPVCVYFASIYASDVQVRSK